MRRPSIPRSSTDGLNPANFILLPSVGPPLRVKWFWEKRRPHQTRAFLARACPCNTLVTVGRAVKFIEMESRCSKRTWCSWRLRKNGAKPRLIVLPHRSGSCSGDVLCDDSCGRNPSVSDISHVFVRYGPECTSRVTRTIITRQHHLDLKFVRVHQSPLCLAQWLRCKGWLPHDSGPLKEERT